MVSESGAEVTYLYECGMLIFEREDLILGKKLFDAINGTERRF